MSHQHRPRVHRGEVVLDIGDDTSGLTPLAVGEYRVARPADRAGLPLSIGPGRVTELDWRPAASP